MGTSNNIRESAACDCVLGLLAWDADAKPELWHPNCGDGEGDVGDWVLKRQGEAEADVVIAGQDCAAEMVGRRTREEDKHDEEELRWFIKNKEERQRRA